MHRTFFGSIYNALNTAAPSFQQFLTDRPPMAGFPILTSPSATITIQLQTPAEPMRTTPITSKIFHIAAHNDAPHYDEAEPRTFLKQPETMHLREE